MPMVTACLHLEVEDCDPMRTASAHTDSPELWIMRPCTWSRHTYVGQVPIGADNLAWLRDKR